MLDPNIPNITSYNVEMRKSMIDKIVFMDKINATVIVDFGSADGSTIAFMRTIFPEITYVGFDISEEMNILARENNPGIEFFSDWAKLYEHVVQLEGDKAVILNSLIHEVYSYGSPDEVAVFWKRIYDSSLFKYVCIRDMCVSDSVTRKSDPLSVIKVRKHYDPAILAQFERKWGSINENWPLVHFLLKYRYKTNWSREVNENYLPISLEELISLIPNGWEPVDFKHYVLPFTRKQIRTDFNIDLQDPTHLQLILEYN
jgi:SAM-dependent methyltransferase